MDKRPVLMMQGSKEKSIEDNKHILRMATLAADGHRGDYWYEVISGGELISLFFSV